MGLTRGLCLLSGRESGISEKAPLSLLGRSPSLECARGTRLWFWGGPELGALGFRGLGVWGLGVSALTGFRGLGFREKGFRV